MFSIITKEFWFAKKMLKYNMLSQANMKFINVRGLIDKQNKISLLYNSTLLVLFSQTFKTWDNQLSS